MSFKFRWPDFSPEFHADAQSMLDSALNRGPKPKVIADDIKVEELCMGTVVSACVSGARIWSVAPALAAYTP